MARLTEGPQRCHREGVRAHDPGPDRVESVVGEIGDPIGVAHDHPLGRSRGRFHFPGMGPDPVEHLRGQVERLETLEDPHALMRVQPFAVDELGEGILAGVPER